MPAGRLRAPRPPCRPGRVDRWTPAAVYRDNRNGIRKPDIGLEKILAKAQENGYVTWKGLLSVLGLVVGVMTTVGGAALYHHTQQPHVGAARIRDIDRIERSIHRLEEKIDELTRRHP